MKNWTPKEIKTLREKHNLSQPAFGSLLGVTGNYVYLMEKGVRTPSKTIKLLLSRIEQEFKRKGEETWQR